MTMDLVEGEDLYRCFECLKPAQHQPAEAEAIPLAEQARRRAVIGFGAAPSLDAPATPREIDSDASSIKTPPMPGTPPMEMRKCGPSL